MKPIFLFLTAAIIFSSCSTSGPSGLFGKKSPHDDYGDKIKSAGLNETTLGRKWFAAAEKSLAAPLLVNLPYSETGYFPADEPKALGIRFNAKRGEKLTINLSKRPTTGFALYLDLWQPAAQVNSSPKFILAADTSSTTINFEVGKEGSYILRLQPELLKGGEVSSKVGSFWGVARDGGARKHEGIDIFAPKRTPLVAAADGVVTRVNENELGGRVVFVSPDGKDYSLYYAHLDEQLVQPGQRVKEGETVGLMGNTGNARTTSPHLHFGIYTNSGAVDPLPFIDRNIKYPEKITAPLSYLNGWGRTGKGGKLYPEPATGGSPVVSLDANTVLKVEAATADWYKVALPGGEYGFVPSSKVSSVSTPIRKISFKSQQSLLDEPDQLAARKRVLPAGQQFNVLGVYKNFWFIKTEDDAGWVQQQNGL